MIHIINPAVSSFEMGGRYRSLLMFVLNLSIHNAFIQLPKSDLFNIN